MSETGTGERPVSNRRSRMMLVAILVAAVAVLAAPPLLQAWFETNACPTVVTRHGFVEKVRWEISRSDCGDGRIVHQLRIIPPKGYSVLAYESEREGPLPVGWTQTGFTGQVVLDRSLAGETGTTVDVPLDAKGRPKEPVMVREGKRKPLSN